MKLDSKSVERWFIALVGFGGIALMVQPAVAQSWVTGTPMQVARWSHTATLLPNGLVLIAGGETTNRYDIPDSAFRATASAELYDPSVGSSTPTSSMSEAHESDIATLLPNGLVLVAGGRTDGGGIVTHSELYDPAAGTWTDTGGLNQERSSFTATLLPNGRVLAVAGYSNDGDTSSAEIYDPVTEVWTTVAPLNYATDSQTATLLTNGLVLVAGGSDSEGGGLTNSSLYNPANNTWAYTGSLNERRVGQAAVLLPNGTVLVVGGVGDNTCEIYNPATATWGIYTNMNDGWYNPNAVLLNNGQVLVVGDDNGDVELYDPQANSWSYADSLPVTGYSQVATLLSSGQVLVTGGDATDYSGPGLDVIETYGSPVIAPSLNVTADPTSGLEPLSVQFSSPDTDSDGNPVTDWSWDFGDGTTSTEQNPSHAYSAGYYSPGLTAYSTFGSTPLNVTGLDAISVSLPSINADVTPESGQTPLTAQFSSSGQDNGGFAVTNWSWTFGDGGTSSAQNPAHTYLNPGVYSPSLVAYSTHSSSPLTIVYGFGTITVTNPPNPYFKTLYSFMASSGSPATNNDGAGPNGGLVLSGDTLYGTAQHGGNNGWGTLFAVNTDGSSFTNLYQFSSSPNSGILPPAGIILSGDTFFGTTYLGGNRGGGGTIFAIGTNGLGYTNLLNYDFNVDANSGREPQAGVTLAGNTLYGATWYGGAYDHGTLSYITTNGATSGILHHFSNPFGADHNLNSDGLFPSAKLVFSGATLYGTAENGGSFAAGTVFAVETNNPGSFRILHYFTATTPQYTGTNNDGANPFAGLVLSGNTLYGTTFGGGKYGYGTVFSVNTNGLNFTNLYNFTGGTDGTGPHGGLTLSGNMLCGTTSGEANLGALSSGTLFSLHTDGSGFTTLYQFSGGYDGANPQGDLLLSGNTLYGTAASGGNSGNGAVFSFTLSAAALPVTLLNPFNNGASFQFQFLTQSGFNHNILYRTNLTVGIWLTNSTVTGNGAVTNISLPYSLFNPSRQGFIRVSTQ